MTLADRALPGGAIWYTVTERPDGQVVIVVQYLKADT
jgi:hypothetical protein